MHKDPTGLPRLSRLLGYSLRELASAEADRSDLSMGYLSWRGGQKIQVCIEDANLSFFEAPSIRYGVYPSSIGSIVLASIGGHICYSSLTEDLYVTRQNLSILYPKARIIKERNDVAHDTALALIDQGDQGLPPKLSLLSPVSEFRRSVWLATCSIGYGSLATYGEVARRANNRNAARAVGSALSANHLAPFIPCHRVIPCSGLLGSYTGGTYIKKNLIEWELSTR